MRHKAPFLFRVLTVLALCSAMLAGSLGLSPVSEADDPKNPTAEQIAETVIAIAGNGMGRAVLTQIRRNGVERGKLTRINSDGRAEEARYELRFVRGEKSEKDKVRLDSKTPQAEFSLIYGDGRIFGIMAESHLKAGRQDLVPGKPLAFGMSITDGCISWDETRAMLDGLAAGVRARRLKAQAAD